MKYPQAALESFRINDQPNPIKFSEECRSRYLEFRLCTNDCRQKESLLMRCAGKNTRLMNTLRIQSIHKANPQKFTQLQICPSVFNQFNIMINFCEEHKRPVKYYCFDNDCVIVTLQCIICIKQHHENCESKLIIDIDRKKNIRIQLPDNLESIQKLMDILLNEFLIGQEFLKSEKDKEVQKFIEFEQIEKDDLTCLLNKQSYKFYFNEDDKKIYVLNIDDYHINELKLMFKESEQALNRYINQFFKQIANLQHSSKSKHHSLKLNSHVNITQEIIPKGIKLKQIIPQSGYYMAISTTQINSDLNLQIKVNNINPEDRYCEVGLLTVQQYQQYNQNKIGKFLVGKYCYCGYRQKGFNGMGPQKPFLGDPSNLENNTIIFFRYNHEDKMVQITNSKNNVQLKCYLDMDVSPEYRFYITLYFQNQEAEIIFNQFYSNVYLKQYQLYMMSNFF